MSAIRKGRCYANALDILVKFQLAGDNSWRLCHGVVIGTGKLNFEKPCGHAWLEKIDAPIVIDAAGSCIPRATYYSAGQVRSVRAFTLGEALHISEKTGTTGPWNTAIIKAESWIKERKKRPLSPVARS